MRVFAISDLHLSFARPKPMELFGEHWRDHPAKIATSWQKLVSPEDIVLIAGDISWAMKLVDVAPDIEWIKSMPGRKVVIKGNHDYWFPGTRRKRVQLFGDEIISLYRNGAVVDDIGFVGSRGISFDPFEIKDQEKWQKDKKRQIGHLLTSLEDLKNLAPEVKNKVALLHYPPTPPGETKSDMTEILKEAGINLCIFGHLHNQEDFDKCIKGLHEGVYYQLTSADYLSFEPIELTSLLPYHEK